MRVIVQGDPSARSSAENKVIGLLRDWSGSHHLPGLCLVHVHVPTGNRTREVDGLLWTPHGLVVLEVQGFTTAQPVDVRVFPELLRNGAGNGCDTETKQASERVDT